MRSKNFNNIIIIKIDKIIIFCSALYLLKKVKYFENKTFSPLYNIDCITGKIIVTLNNSAKLEIIVKTIIRDVIKTFFEMTNKILLYISLSHKYFSYLFLIKINFCQFLK